MAASSPRLNLQQYTDTTRCQRMQEELFKKDATFFQVPGLSDVTCVSFESVNFCGYYIQHMNFELRLDEFKNKNDQLYKEDATFLRTASPPYTITCAATFIMR